LPVAVHREEGSLIPTYHKILFAAFAALLIAFGGAFTLQTARNDATSVDPLVPRTTSSGTQIPALQTRLRAQPADQRAYTLLGAAYLQQARVTGDPAYYPKAEAVLNKALDLAPDDFDAMIAQGTLALARHQFRDALTWSERARVLNPSRALVYGIAGDAHVELGEYDVAWMAFDQMNATRPDLNSYARISYARELLGDIDGALDAMQHAADAGASDDESTAWTRVQLGHLYFNYKNNLARAESEYRRALNGYPGYLYAIAALARLRAAQHNYASAIELYARVTNVMPLPEFVIALGDIYAANGQRDEAEREYALVRVEEQLYRANGVDMDLEMALFDADHDHDLPDALAHAREQMTRRGSIKAADVLAWTLFKSGDAAGAHAAMQQALRLGAQDALMFFHAGMIANRLGDAASARDYLSRALVLNPAFSLLHADEARKTLSTLQ